MPTKREVNAAVHTLVMVTSIGATATYITQRLSPHRNSTTRMITSAAAFWSGVATVAALKR